jgi:hypothetical protein
MPSIEKAEQTFDLVLLLAILAIVGFGLYELTKAFSSASSGEADTGTNLNTNANKFIANTLGFGDTAANGKPKCSHADYDAGNCVSGDGSSACGFTEFWFGTSCYKGIPSTVPAPAAAAPGLPAGYDPNSGLIDNPDLSYETAAIPGTTLVAGDGGGE